MTFNESNTIEAYIRDRLKTLGWNYQPHANLNRQPQDLFIEDSVRTALIRLNPEIAAEPNRADEVLYQLRDIILKVRSDGLVSANQMMTDWLRGDKTMPFGDNYDHIPIHLINFADLSQNEYIVTQQYTFRAGKEERRADIILLINGFPLVLIEAKTPVRKSVSWFDGALQVQDDYEKNVPELFTCNVFSVASEGKELRYGSIGLPLEKWGVWRNDETVPPKSLRELTSAIEGLLRRDVVLEMLSRFTLFATDNDKRRSKIVARYQQYEAANKIQERVLAGYPKKGLIWHFQGSGKSLLMVFAAQKLRLHPALKNPTVLIIVDRVDLDTQIGNDFLAADIPNLVKAKSREELETLLRQDTRKIIITTIFKFAEVETVLNERDNIICMVDEAHRTQEGDLGRKMRTALPNAFLFGLTGTPINERDRNTFAAFGAQDDENGYLSRYDLEDSLRDGATLPLHFEPRLIELHIDKDAIDEAYAELTGELSDLDRDNLSKTASRMAVLAKAPNRIAAICQDIAQHYTHTIAPNSFKGMVVTYDQECCLLYKAELDKHLPPDASEIVISASGNDERFKPYKRTRDQEEKLLERYRKPQDPLKLLIVTAKLLTGFNAPILQAMYLDKPLKNHTLLQAICRTNRRYGISKTHGLIVDYLGVFDNVAKSLEFDEGSIPQTISNHDKFKKQIPSAMQQCLRYFMGCNLTLAGYEGLMAAQDCLPNDSIRDDFAQDYNTLSKLWEIVSPDPILHAYEKDYRWLTQVYESVRPTSGMGRLIWHALGAKTLELIHDNIYVDNIRDDLDKIVLDAEIVSAVLNTPNPKTAAKNKAREIEFKIALRLRKHIDNPEYKKLSERLENLKQRHEQGQLISIEFLKQLLVLARDLLKVENITPIVENENRGKAALTELFREARSDQTPVMIERIVNDIDEIVRLVRFPDWQHSNAGEREVKQALRKTLLKYKLHQDKDLFAKAYEYIRQYY